MRRTRGLTLLLATAALCSGSLAHQDPFEIQVYDATVAGPLEPGIEIHLNHFFEGTTEPGPGARCRPSTSPTSPSSRTSA